MQEKKNGVFFSDDFGSRNLVIQKVISPKNGIPLSFIARARRPWIWSGVVSRGRGLHVLLGQAFFLSELFKRATIGYHDTFMSMLSAVDVLVLLGCAVVPLLVFSALGMAK